MRISERYPGRRAFVTGAGSGLGLAFCELLARDGWTIGMTDVRPEALSEAAAGIRSAGAAVSEYVFDVTDRPAFAEALDAFVAEAGGLDLMVNNAGVAGGGYMGEYSLEDWDWLMGINLNGVVNGCHFATPVLKQQGSGHIINIASAAAFTPVPRMTAYCTAKAGVKMLSEVLFTELENEGVGVTVGMPEFFQTNLHERTRGQTIAEAKWMITRSRYKAEEVAQTILDAAAAGRLHAVFGKEAKIVSRLMRLFPIWSMRRIRRTMEFRQAHFEKRRAEFEQKN